MDAAVSPKSIAWLAGFLEGRFGVDAGISHSVAATVGEDVRLWVEAASWTQTGETKSQRFRELLEAAGLAGDPAVLCARRASDTGAVSHARDQAPLVLPPGAS